jgi:hypothetical protein
MQTDRKQKFGKQEMLFNFIVNPYPDQKISLCPICRKRTGQRKVPLFIHVNPMHPVALNYTCKYCKQCDLLVAHKHEVEDLLARLFEKQRPEIVGNDYLIIGTMEKKAWREGLHEPKEVTEIRTVLHDFKSVYSEMRITKPGWYGPNQQPPIMEPPNSSKWQHLG